MEEFAVVVGAIGLAATLGEIIGAWLRSIRSRIDKQKVRKFVDALILFFSCAFIFGLLSVLMWASTAFVYTGLSATQRPSLSLVLMAFAALFTLGLLFVHVFAYCFAGVLNRWPFGGRFWPKGIDYVYYMFGSAVLALLVAEIYGEQAIRVEALRVEVVIGVYLFNLKLLKTSYELFPGTFKWSQGWVRDPFFGKVI